jgi:cysteine desulfurase
MSGSDASNPTDPIAGIWPEPAPHPSAGYLDAVGGQPVLPVALRALVAALEQSWSDPARLHHQGRRAGLVLDTARTAIARFLGVPASGCFLGSSGSDVLRAAVTGLYQARTAEGAPARVLIGAAESMAVVFAANACSGAEVIKVPVDSLGRIDTSALRAELAQGAAVVCAQQANAEVGTVQPVDDIHAACRAAGVPMVSDAIQVAGHRELGSAWDAAIVVPRDWGGPPGCAVLMVKPDIRWRPPEAPDRGWVGGFPDVAAVAAAASAAEYVEPHWREQSRVHFEMTDRVRAVASTWPGVQAVGDPVERLPHIVTLVADGVVGEAVVTDLDRQAIAVASGSACTADARMPSHVLEAMGIETTGSLRVSLPYGCTADTIDAFLATAPEVLLRARN